MPTKGVLQAYLWDFLLKGLHLPTSTKHLCAFSFTFTDMGFCHLEYSPKRCGNMFVRPQIKRDIGN
eukprot:3410643-Amphidinium_carterae.1